MSQQQTINVNVTGVSDEKVSQNDQVKQFIATEMVQRFYLVNSRGGQTFWKDLKTGDITDTSYLIQHISKVMHERDSSFDPGSILSPNNPLRQAIKMAYWRKLTDRPMYFAGNTSLAVWHNEHYYPNIWKEPEVKPTEYSSIAKARSKGIGAWRFIDHLQTMLGDTEKDLDHKDSKAGYLIRMLAYRYQVHDFRRQQKPHVAFFFYGKQGYGKSIFSTTLNMVFGTTACMVVPDERSLKSLSSVDLFSRTWALVDEVNIVKGSTDYNTIKTLTGGTLTDAERKYENFQERYVPAQLFMFSQHPPTFIEAGDRRFFISKWETDFESDTQKKVYFEDYNHWLQKEGGYEAIAGLLKLTDITGVSLAAHAMITPEKRQVVAMVTDNCAQDIKSKLEEEPLRICWTEDDFLGIFIENEVSKNQRKYKMEEAGLVVQQKRKYEGRLSRQFYLRQGWDIRISNGKGSFLINLKDEFDIRQLKDDSGYNEAMNSSRNF